MGKSSVSPDGFEVDGWTLPFSIFVNDGAVRGGVNDGLFRCWCGQQKNISEMVTRLG